MIYLDNAATTPVKEAAKQAMEPFFSDKYSNPSSAYEFGVEAYDKMEECRARIAKMINCEPWEIYFTSGGTESDNFAIKQVCRTYKDKGNHIITTEIEHHAVLNSCNAMEREGFKVTKLRVDENGRINLNDLINAITKDTILISIMYANNEIGTIEPIYKIGAIAHKNKILFHSDAVQAFGHIPVDVKYMNIDILSASGHKFGGPKGIGFMYVKDGVKIYPFMDGGSQEKGMRAGTGNVAGIVGMSAAAMDAYDNMRKNVKYTSKLRDYMAMRIQKEIKGVKINGHPHYRLPNNLNISVEGVEGTSLMVLLDNEGICVSTGSACTQGNGEPSHVLKAINLDKKYLGGSIRMTLSERNTRDEIDYTVDCLKKCTEKLRSNSPL